MQERSIFRQRALDRYMRRQEEHVVLRLVSPRVFLSLWLLLLLAVSGGALVWSVQEPVVIAGRGLVVQAQVMDEKNTNGIVVLLLFAPDQQANLRAGQPVTIAIASTKITFHSTIQTVEAGVMSPAEIGAQIHAQLPLVMTIAGPAVVAVAPVEPMALARTYLGSQCQVEVQIGTRSALSLLPGYERVDQFFLALHDWIWHIKKS